MKCSCGKPFPEDGGKEGVCECCSGCALTPLEVACLFPEILPNGGEPGGYRVCDCGRYSQETQGLCGCGRQR